MSPQSWVSGAELGEDSSRQGAGGSPGQHAVSSILSSLFFYHCCWPCQTKTLRYEKLNITKNNIIRHASRQNEYEAPDGDGISYAAVQRSWVFYGLRYKGHRQWKGSLDLAFAEMLESCDLTYQLHYSLLLGQTGNLKVTSPLLHPATKKKMGRDLFQMNPGIHS